MIYYIELPRQFRSDQGLAMENLESNRYLFYVDRFDKLLNLADALREKHIPIRMGDTVVKMNVNDFQDAKTITNLLDDLPGAESEPIAAPCEMSTMRNYLELVHNMYPVGYFMRNISDSRIDALIDLAHLTNFLDNDIALTKVLQTLSELIDTGMNKHTKLTQCEKEKILLFLEDPVFAELFAVHMKISVSIFVADGKFHIQNGKLGDDAGYLVVESLLSRTDFDVKSIWNDNVTFSVNTSSLTGLKRIHTYFKTQYRRRQDGYIPVLRYILEKQMVSIDSHDINQIAKLLVLFSENNVLVQKHMDLLQYVLHEYKPESRDFRILFVLSRYKQRIKWLIESIKPLLDTRHHPKLVQQYTDIVNGKF